MKKIVTAGICLALLSGCATQTYTLAPQSQATPSYDKAQTFFVSGIGGASRALPVLPPE